MSETPPSARRDRIRARQATIDPAEAKTAAAAFIEDEYQRDTAVPLKVEGLYDIYRLMGGNVLLSVRGSRTFTLSRDEVQLLAAALTQVLAVQS